MRSAALDVLGGHVVPGILTAVASVILLMFWEWRRLTARRDSRVVLVALIGGVGVGLAAVSLLLIGARFIFVA